MFNIYRMGCECKHDANFAFDRPRGSVNYLMLYVKTQAIFDFGGKTVRCEPNTFIIYNKDTPRCYRACGNEYINDWMIFDCSEKLSDMGVVFDELVYIGESIDVSKYFKLISDCYYRTGNMRSAGYLLKALFAEIFSESEQGIDYSSFAHYRELLNLRSRIYSATDEEWSVERMAQQISVSEPYLHMLYKKAFGVTCNQDVINSRIEQAQHYLSYSDMTIEEVAFTCGYKNAVHFSRQFKQVSGMTPSQWRKSGETV